MLQASADAFAAEVKTRDIQTALRNVLKKFGKAFQEAKGHDTKTGQYDTITPTPIPCHIKDGRQMQRLEVNFSWSSLRCFWICSVTVPRGGRGPSPPTGL